MHKVWWNSLLAAPAFLGAALVASAGATAAEVQSGNVADVQMPNQPLVVAQYESGDTAELPVTEVSSLDQVTSVSQLSDVQPTDWAFQALQSLVERYGCIAGYPDGTYRGNRALTRYEFAAGLNACLDRVNELIAAGTADLVTKEDLAALQRLQEEFAAELATLRGRVDALEARTAELEANQFSTTTKLVGEVILGITDAFGDASATNFTAATSGSDIDNYQTTFNYRARLNFDTSFFGTDRLRTRLEAGNVISPDAGNGTAPGREGRLSYELNTSSALNVGAFEYRFQVGPAARFWVAANARELPDLVDTVTPFANEGQTTLTRFGRYNPIFRTGNDKGVAVNLNLGRFLRVDAAYLAGEANDPAIGQGLFNGDYAALGQLIFTPSSSIKIGLTYVNGYNDTSRSTGTGSRASDLVNAVSGASLGRVSFNSYGVQANFRISPQFELGGWFGYTTTRLLTGVGGDAESYNYAVTLAFPDLGAKGNLGGIIFGMQPKLSSTSTAALGAAVFPAAQYGAGTRNDPSTGFHIEGFYRLQVSDNISVTPGVIWLTAPNHNDRNGDIVVGTLRTTFSF